MTHRTNRRAFTALEVLLVTALLTAASVGLVGVPREAPRQQVQATSEASELRVIAQRHYVTTGDCPTVRALMRAGALAHTPIDPWGTEYWFACKEGTVTVVSDGADRAPFTGDDIGDPVAWGVPAARRRGSS